MIKIGKYAIDIDRFNYIAGKIYLADVKQKDGSVKQVERILNPVFCGSLRLAFESLLKMEQKEKLGEKDMSLAEAIAIVNETTESFNALLETAIKENLKESECAKCTTK